MISNLCPKSETARGGSRKPGFLGINVKVEGEWLMVINTLEDSPARQGGVLAGDRIIKINGKSTENRDIADCLRQLAGSAGQDVTLTVVRPSKKNTESFDIILTRAVRNLTPSRLVRHKGLSQRKSEPIQWKGNKIVSRVLPYTDLVSLFVRLPIAHCAATGKGVGVAVVGLFQDVHIETIIKQTAPDAVVKTYVWDSERNDSDGLLRSLTADACRIVVLPDGHQWPASPIQDLVQQLIDDSMLVVLPSDLSEEKEKIQTVNILQDLGVLTVGRVNRQSLVLEGSREGHKPFNAHIRDIHTDVFSTVGIGPSDHTLNPVATVSGMAALVWEKWPDLSAKEVRERIVSGAPPVWQNTSIETGKWRGSVSVDPVTTEYTPRDEKAVFRFRTADAPGALGVDTEIPWFLNMLNCHKAWEITRGQGMVVAISDQGFHLKHPALKDKIKTQQSFGPKSLTSPGQNFHGTDMSRILLSVAPEAQIIPLLCSSKSSETLPQVIAKSFEYALDNKVDVISASWWSKANSSHELLATIRETVDGGTVVSWCYDSRNGGRGYSCFLVSLSRLLSRPVEIELHLCGVARECPYRIQRPLPYGSTGIPSGGDRGRIVRYRPPGRGDCSPGQECESQAESQTDRSANI
jgi:hypothetical protein